MTRIRYHAPPRWRESEVVYRDGGRARTVTVALEPAALLLRLKGTRRALRLPLSAAYLQAAMIEARAVRAAKALKRKAKGTP